MRPARIASLLLSVFLQLAPLVRVAVADTAAVLSPIVALLRWAAGAAAVAGSFHAVSGATGITITQGATKVPSPKGTNGVNFGIRVLVNSSERGTATFYRATGLPPGITLLSTSQGTIGGIPNKPGVYAAKISGWKDSTTTEHGATFDVTFTILDPLPVITTQPVPVTVEAGQSASLSVVATGPNLTYRWIKGGVEVSLTQPGATNATLTFNPAAVSDTGEYQVRVNSGGGSTLSSSVTLTVNPAAATPPVIVTPPTNATVALGGEATFAVVATGSGPLSYQWSKGGAALTAETRSTLTLQPVAVDSGGTYTVRVSNAGGEATATAELIVAPVIVAQVPVAPLVVHAGETVRLSVTAAGPPPLTYQWQRNSTPMPAATGAELVFEPATLDHSGTYTVTVSSPGAAAASSPMRVEIRPLALEPPRLNGPAVTLIWTAIPGRPYRIEASTSLSAARWTPAGQATPANAAATFETPATPDALFFRLVPQ
jgi:hypothetical protein